MKHRDLDPSVDWEFFPDDCVLSAEAMQLIRPLTEESATVLWVSHICSEPQARHPMLLPDDAWPSKLWSSDTRVEWQSDWNDRSLSVFADWLAANIHWDSSSRVLFTYSRSRSIETPWRLFREYWRLFLFDDEGPILWSLYEATALAFSPQGFAVLGERAIQE